jgi:hypothetical protein
MPTQMQTIAAYYVFVANEHAYESRPPRYHVVATRPGRATRLVAALTSLARPLRRGAPQAA